MNKDSLDVCVSLANRAACTACTYSFPLRNVVDLCTIRDILDFFKKWEDSYTMVTLFGFTDEWYTLCTGCFNLASTRAVVYAVFHDFDYFRELQLFWDNL